MRKLLAFSMIAGFVTLAILIGQRMSNDAMAVMIGVIFGVAASIPTSLLIALAARGKAAPQPSYRRDDYQPVAPAPQIYVVTSGQSLPAGLMAPGASVPAQSGGAFFANPPQRRYRVVGEAEYWLNDNQAD